MDNVAIYKIGVFKTKRGKETSIIRDNNYKKRRYMNLKSASNLNGNLNCSKELEHYAS